MAEKELDEGKRRFLLTATTVASGVAAGAAAVPFGNQIYRGNNTPLYPGAAPDRSIRPSPIPIVTRRSASKASRTRSEASRFPPDWKPRRGLFRF